MRGVKGFSAGALLGLLGAATAATAAPDEERVAIELYQAPRLNHAPQMDYPERALHLRRDGWVDVEMMVSKQGRPYEMTVADSFGGPDLEAAALQYFKRVSFIPARSGRNTVDAGMKVRVRYRLDQASISARPEFIRSYGEFVDKVAAGDRAGADALLPQLEALNVYEDVYAHLALYRYHGRWGTAREQLEALKAALAYESKDASYMGRTEYVAAASGLLVLYVKTGNFGEALGTWEDMNRNAPKADFSALKPVIAELEQLRKSGRTFRQAGEITRGTSWFNTLFTNHFEIQVQAGAVRELKLRCAKDYLLFAYQRDVRYDVKPQAGLCRLEVIGDPATRFELVES